MLSELHKLFKLIWQKKKCCDYKSWKYFLFYFFQCRGALYARYHTCNDLQNWKSL